MNFYSCLLYTSIEQLVSELVDMLEGIIGYMDDQYMWCRYSVIPLLPQLLSIRYDVDQATVQNMYEMCIRDRVNTSLPLFHLTEYQSMEYP